MAGRKKTEEQQKETEQETPEEEEQQEEGADVIELAEVNEKLAESVNRRNEALELIAETAQEDRHNLELSGPVRERMRKIREAALNALGR
jgi:hypothetical protein